MPIGYDYRCKQCSHEWMLFSKRFTVGPTQWGATKYTCFSCQTFLTVVVSLDSNSWAIWYRKHKDDVHRNTVTDQLAATIIDLLSKQRGLTPITLDFQTIHCPTCGDSMSTTPFGQHLMKCPKCEQYAGEFDGGDGISIYAFPDSEDGTEQRDAREPE